MLPEGDARLAPPLVHVVISCFLMLRNVFDIPKVQRLVDELAFGRKKGVTGYFHTRCSFKVCRRRRGDPRGRCPSVCRTPGSAVQMPSHCLCHFTPPRAAGVIASGGPLPIGAIYFLGLNPWDGAYCRRSRIHLTCIARSARLLLFESGICPALLPIRPRASLFAS